MPTRLTLTNPALLPVQAFFNSIGDSSLVRVVDCLTRNVGYAINETDCSFASDLDDGEETFDGVRFSLFEDYAIISFDQLREYLRMISTDHVAAHPEDRDILDSLLARPIDAASLDASHG